MTNVPRDFIVTLGNSNTTIKGIKGHLKTAKIGTFFDGTSKMMMKKHIVLTFQTLSYYRNYQ